MNQFTTKAEAQRLTGLSYLGSISKTVKHKKSMKYGELTYSLYMAPAKSSGYEVCPGRTKECTTLCLNESGMNSMVRNGKGDVINRSRITKTRLFFEDREFFMQWMISEIQSGITKAKKMGFTYSVRLNNTSDINPLEFHLNGKNILEMFPNVMFYDYTKVENRIELMKIYKNYDVTFSFNGYNLNTCQKMLMEKIRVAMVFKAVPEEFMGYKVIDGDKYDMRYKDDNSVIIGIKYKRVRTKLTSDIKFVIQ
jgi:hypothetical protein